MYCPRCAAQNLEGAKFCRGCGTNLEPVAIALAQPNSELTNQSSSDLATANALEKRRDGLKRIVRGAGLLSASGLVGALLALFSPENDWIIIWLIFSGWMACWGVVSLVAGIAALIEARFASMGAAQSAKYVGSPTAPLELGVPDTTPQLSLPPSITERTTRTLTKRHSSATEN